MTPEAWWRMYGWLDRKRCRKWWRWCRWKNPFISGSNPVSPFSWPETHGVPYIPGYASPILSPHALLSDLSKFDANAAIAVAVAINKPKIEVNEANNKDIGVSFMVYAGAMFGGLPLVGGGGYYLWNPWPRQRGGGSRNGGEINRDKEGNRCQGQIPGDPNQHW